MPRVVRSSASKKSKKLLIRRNNIIGSARLIQEYDENFIFDRDFPQLKFRLETLDKLWEKFNEVQSEMSARRNFPRISLPNALILKHTTFS